MFNNVSVMENYRVMTNTKLMEYPLAFGKRSQRDFVIPESVDPVCDEIVSLCNPLGQEIIIINTFLSNEDKYKSIVKCYFFNESKDMMSESLVPITGKCLAAEFDNDKCLIIFTVQEIDKYDVIMFSKQKSPGVNDFHEAQMFVTNDLDTATPMVMPENPVLGELNLCTPIALDTLGQGQEEKNWYPCKISNIILYRTSNMFKVGVVCTFDGGTYIFMDWDWGRPGTNGRIFVIGNEFDECFPSTNYIENQSYGLSIMTIKPGIYTEYFMIGKETYSIPFKFTMPDGYRSVGKCERIDLNHTVVHIKSGAEDAFGMLVYDYPKTTISVDVLYKFKNMTSKDFRYSVTWEEVFNHPYHKSDHCHVLIQDRENNLYHATMNINAYSTGYTANPAVPILDGVSFHKFTSHIPGLSFVYFDTRQSKYKHMEYCCLSTNWFEIDIDIKPEIIIEKCYSTEMTFLENEHNIPLVDEDIEIWADDRLLIETNGGYHYIDSDKKVRLKTDNRGMVFFMQITSSLDCIPIKMYLPGRMQSNEAIELNPSVKIQNKVKNITARDILEGKTIDSLAGTEQYLMPVKFRTQQNAEALASTLHQTIKLVNHLQEPYDENGLRKVSRFGLSNNMINVPETSQCWSLQIEGDKIIYSELTPQQALQSRNALYMDENGVELPRWLSAIGDFFCGIGRGIMRLARVIFEGIKATVNIVINGIEYLFEIILDTVGKVVHFIECIFTSIAVFFEDLFRWIGFLFKWSDILLTKNAIKEVMLLVFRELPDFVDVGKKKSLQMIDIISEQLDSLFEQAVSAIIPGQGMGTYTEKTTPPDKHGTNEAVVMMCLCASFLHKI